MNRKVFVLLVMAVYSWMQIMAGDTLKVRYFRFGNDYDGWCLWVWNATDNSAGMNIQASGKDESGVVFEIDPRALGLSGKKIGLLPKFGQWESKDPPDRFFHINQEREVYLMQNDSIVYTQKPDLSPKLMTASIGTETTLCLTVAGPVSSEGLASGGFTLRSGSRDIPVAPPIARTIGPGMFRLDFVIPALSLSSLEEICRGEWRLTSNHMGEIPVRLGEVLDAPMFRSDTTLGIIRENERTVLRVFAPDACSVVVVLYPSSAGPAARELPMHRLPGGVWETAASESLEGLYYTIKVEREGMVREGIDPYSRCNTSHNGRGLIVRDNTPVHFSPVFDISQSVIYELHIRDFTISGNSGIRAKGKYLGLTETGTKHPDHPEILTGIDHLSELGVNVIQIMPVQDFENNEASDDYNWGYMPVHFNSPDGWYASRTDDSSRVRELKTMIDALHRKGFKVVLDVVYNHTAETDPTKMFGLGAMAGNYYYRMKEDGTFWNGSGCGNEFRSESPMGRKFILDSLKYWVSEYRMDGFRFDLMGLIDLETMEHIVRELRAINPEVLIYGEPWAGGDTGIAKTEKGSQRSKGFSVFNDVFRDALKGSVWDNGPGFVQAGINREEVVRGIRGSIDLFADSPLETINYTSCHDNQTLWDRITLSAGSASTQEMVFMHRLAAAIVLTSQGIPFIHSGQEMLRTKKGEHNSYNLPDEINRIDWDWKWNNLDTFRYFQGLIRIRAEHPSFRMEKADGIRKFIHFFDGSNLPSEGGCIGYSIDGGACGDIWTEILVLINPSRIDREFQLSGGIWKVAADREKVASGDFRSVETRVEVKAVSMMILFKD
ncbi:MAG: type I pullulanase [Candidatus Wallbacteria bacterium]|nr:type I pullulanase [Candidatus Wallbacteria bacterium]